MESVQTVVLTEDSPKSSNFSRKNCNGEEAGDPDFSWMNLGPLDDFLYVCELCEKHFTYSQLRVHIEIHKAALNLNSDNNANQQSNFLKDNQVEVEKHFEKNQDDNSLVLDEGRNPCERPENPKPSRPRLYELCVFSDEGQTNDPEKYWIFKQSVEQRDQKSDSKKSSGISDIKQSEKVDQQQDILLTSLAAEFFLEKTRKSPKPVSLPEKTEEISLTALLNTPCLLPEKMEIPNIFSRNPSPPEKRRKMSGVREDGKPNSPVLPDLVPIVSTAAPGCSNSSKTPDINDRHQLNSIQESCIKWSTSQNLSLAPNLNLSINLTHPNSNSPLNLTKSQMTSHHPSSPRPAMNLSLTAAEKEARLLQVVINERNIINRSKGSAPSQTANFTPTSSSREVTRNYQDDLREVTRMPRKFVCDLCYFERPTANEPLLRFDSMIELEGHKHQHHYTPKYVRRRNYQYTDSYYF